jgi:ketosteroid isomerase-like protein
MLGRRVLEHGVDDAGAVEPGGTTAIGLTTMRWTALNGNPYSNQYVWQLEFSGGKINSITEFTDSLYLARVMGISV